jgi:formiminoglutamase
MDKILNPYHFKQGDSPLLVSMPHSGIRLLPEMEERLTDEARLLPDTDWFIPELYSFLQNLNVSVIGANYSRYVVDLNRPVDDQPLYTSKTTGLFPEILFADKPVFKPGQQLTDAEKQQIKQEVWHPYHQHILNELERIKAKFGYAILFDAHSIAAQVPMLFEGTLPDFNFGTNDGQACAAIIGEKVNHIVAATGYSHVVNGRFKGGYITRGFGQPENDIHAIQLELSQATYLADREDYQLDSAKVVNVAQVLQAVIQSLLDTGNPSHHQEKELTRGAK